MRQLRVSEPHRGRWVDPQRRSIYVALIAWTCLTACGSGFAPTAVEGKPFDAVFRASGPAGGPFTGSGGPFEVENTTTSTYRYEISCDEDWVAWDVPSQGTVAPGDKVVLTLSIDATKAPSATGTHDAVVTVDNTLTQEVFGAIRVSLVVAPEPPAPPPPVSETSSGWFEPNPSPDSRMVYVSSSDGNDVNGGLNENQPKRTIAAGLALLCNGFPDYLHLKRGDTWTTGLGNFVLSGRSQTEPMVVLPYGDTALPRPLIQRSGPAMNMDGATPRQYLVFMGLHFQGSWAPNSSGIQIRSPTRYVLYEDLLVERYTVNIEMQDAGVRDVRVHRCVVVDAANNSGHSTGFYIAYVQGLDIEGCVIDHNGWRAGVPGFEPTVFNRNIYIQYDSRNVTLRNNILSRSSSEGAQMRSGGICEGNLFLDNAIHLGVGHDLGAGEPAVTTTVKGNVMLHAKNLSPTAPRGGGMSLGHIASGEISYNILAHNDALPYPVPVHFNTSFGAGISNLDFHHNCIYDWQAPLDVEGTQLSSVNFRDNDIQEPTGVNVWYSRTSGSNGGFTSSSNRFWSSKAGNWFANPDSIDLATWQARIGDTGSTATQVQYPNAARTIVDYDQSSPYPGAGSIASFLSEARKQSRTYWRAKFTAAEAVKYFRANFGITVPE